MIENKKTLKIVLGVIIAVALVVLMIIIFTKPYVEPDFRDIEIPTTYSIRNNTPYDFLTEITSVGLQEIGLDTIYISIYTVDKEIAEKVADKGRELLAHIIAGPEGSNQYNIYVAERNVFVTQFIEIIAHELIHLQQHQRGDLYYFGDDRVMYKELPYYHISEIDYIIRPWERDAFKQAPELEKKIRERLYGKFD